VLPIRFVARTIRFVASRAMLQCSDARGERHCKPQTDVRRIYLQALTVVVDNKGVQSLK